MRESKRAGQLGIGTIELEQDLESKESIESIETQKQQGTLGLESKESIEQSQYE